MDRLKFGAGLSYRWFTLTSEAFNSAKKLDEPLRSICMFAFTLAAGMGFVLSGMWLIDGIVEFFSLFNGKEDDKVRKKINENNCDKLNDISDNELIRMIRVLLDGPTLDEDEKSILKLIGCLNPDRIRMLLSEIGFENLSSQVNGAENERLLIMLLQKGIIGYKQLTDDASRRFINNAREEVLSSLSLIDVRELIINMLEGTTDNDDERAILKLLSSLSCEKLRELVSMDRVKPKDLLKEFQGSENNRLEDLLRECGIEIPDVSWYEEL